MKKFIGLIIILFLVLANSPMVLAMSNKATNKNSKSITATQKQKTTTKITKENPAKTVKTVKVVKSTQTPTPVPIPTPTFTRTPTPVVYRQPSLTVTSVSLPVGSTYVTKNYPTSISNSAKGPIHPTTTPLQAIPRLTPTSPFRPVRAVVATPTPTPTLPPCSGFFAIECVQERIAPLCFPDGKSENDPDFGNVFTYPTAKLLWDSGHGHRLGLFDIKIEGDMVYTCFWLIENDDKVWYIDLEWDMVYEPINP
jgi:hypothetical protein